MADWYVGSVQHAAVAQWAATTAYVVGNIVRQLAAPAVGSERCFRCTTAGTSGGSEPAWNLGKGTTTTSGTATFTEVTGNATYNWAAPHARLTTAASNSWPVAGDRVFVAHNHAETSSALTTIPASSTVGSPDTPLLIMCVNAAGSVPPVSADLRTTATVTTTGSAEIRIMQGGAGAWYVYGIQFSAAGGFRMAGAAGNYELIRFDSCKFTFTGGTFMLIGSISVNGPSYVEMVNTPIVFSSTGQAIYVNGEFVWKDTASAIGAGSVPTLVFDASSGTSTIGNTNILLKNLDLSAINTTLFNNVSGANGNVRGAVVNCKLHASVTAVSAGISRRCQEYLLIGCDSSGDSSRNEKHMVGGKITTEKTILRSSGASDGLTAVSWKFSMVNTPSTTASRQYPVISMPIQAWNNSTGAALTASVEVVSDGVTFKNDELWLEVEYLGDSGSPRASKVSSEAADQLAAGSNNASSSETWTTTGLASPTKQTLSVSFTPQQAGPVRAVIKCAKPNTTVYVDPKLAIAA